MMTGHSIISKVAMPTLLQAVLLLNKLQKTQQKNQNFSKNLFACSQVNLEASK